MFGLTEADVAYIKSVISGFIELEQAKIFDSRAKATYKEGPCAGGLRGLNYQNLHGQGKLVSVMLGKVFD